LSAGRPDAGSADKEEHLGMTQLLTDRFGEALVYAERAHRAQTRKGTTIPYVAHLLAVASLVLEHGGGEDQAIAALLHDVVEDQGGAAAAAEIRARFGDRVADIVLACTDTEATPKPPWRARKEAYVASVAGKSDDAILVTAADKLHNASAILEDYRVLGEALWRASPAAATARSGTIVPSPTRSQRGARVGSPSGSPGRSRTSRRSRRRRPEDPASPPARLGSHMARGSRRYHSSRQGPGLSVTGRPGLR
jgi:hypothetical protein